MATGTSFDNIKNILAIFSAASPFIILYLNFKINKKSKKDDDYRQLREKNETLEKELAAKTQKERDEKVNAKITELQKDVKGLKSDVSEITKNVEALSEEFTTKVTSTLDDVLNRQDINLAYCQSLSTLITTIGEGLRDQKMNGNLTDAITKHQTKERELFASVFKSSC